MRLNVLLTTSFVLVGGTAPISAQERATESPDPNFWHASAGVVAVNGLTWAYNWYVQRWHWANVGTRAWWKNLRDGFIWDDDAFMDNQLAHPYHGSLYFNAGRGAGYGFWSSTAFAAAGSLGWELLTENVRPSLNDLINTTLGGIALGEATFRMSAFLVSSSRSPRFGHTAGAVLLNPVGQTQRLLRNRRVSVPDPESGGVRIAVGSLRGVEAPAAAEPQRSFMELSFQYGSPFDQQIARPYDAFDFTLRLSPEHSGIITHAAVSGLLARDVITRSSRAQLLLGLFQHFEYDEIPGSKASSQSLSGALLFQRQLGSATDLVMDFHVETLVLAALSSDHNHYRNRDYDYGPGVGGRFTAAVRRERRELLRLEGRMAWVHSLYGAEADHIATTVRASAMVPVLRTVGIGADVGLRYRRSFYRDQPRVLHRTPELRAYLAWSPS
jgi:hypothetical protein